MTKQVLDVQQMQHLQELGLELKETMLYWVVYEAGHENNFVTTKENAMEVIDESCGMLPAYTLQDVLDALPKMIYPFPVHKIGFELCAVKIKQNKEDMEEKNLKPFDLQKAREGKPVCTRDGRKARIICFDRKLFYRKVSYPILALVERSDGEDDVCGYNEKGKVLIEDGAEYKDDLMMLPEKKEGWVNILKDYDRRLLDSTVYPSPEEARRNGEGNRNHIATVRIEWEE